VCFSNPSYSQSILKEDVKAAVKTLKSVRGIKNNFSDMRFGVVYNPNNNSSGSEAKEVQAILGDLYNSSRVSLVPINKLGSVSNIDVFYVVSNLSSHYDKIKSSAVSNKVFSISLDSTCARQSCCLIALEKTGNNVNVLMNNDALQSAGFDVDSILKYMAVIL